MAEQSAVHTEYLRMPQAAAYIGMSQQFLRKVHRMGKGPERMRAGSKCIVFTRQALDSWLASRIESSGARNQ